MTVKEFTTVQGGRANYGPLAGVLCLCSSGPRLPGDPLHAQTFDFPVIHGTVEDITIRDLINNDRECLPGIIKVAKQLEARGVRFITTGCGLFAPLQEEIGNQLSIPFLSSSIRMVSILKPWFPAGKNVGLITAHSGILTEAHLEGSGFSMDEVVIQGMESYPEFSKVVLEGADEMDIELFRADVINAARELKAKQQDLGLVVLECPNLITFRAEIQQVMQLPVFDIVSLTNFFAASFTLNRYDRKYV
jgi:hypothetical protein